MQTLKLADDLMPAARDGFKRVTVRNGKRDVQLGELVFESTNGTEPPITVNVTKVVVAPIKTLPDWAIMGEGLDNNYELLEVLLRFYPAVTLDSEVTAIEFEAKSAHTNHKRITIDYDLNLPWRAKIDAPSQKIEIPVDVDSNQTCTIKITMEALQDLVSIANAQGLKVNFG